MRPRFGEATSVAAALSLLFVVVYGGTNWIAAHRVGVGTWYAGWERQIPFIPSMIVPYMSIDLFFVGAPFLCSTREELRIFSRRIAAATIVAGIFFLLFPFRYAFSRPPVTGFIGNVFQWFGAIDRPYNLVPSLHITFSVILAATYLRHTASVVRLLCAAWFVVIVLSAVLTFQHHLIDVVAGAALGILSLYFFSQSEEQAEVMVNRRIGLYYALGSALLAGAGIALWPWGGWLLWPALSLGIVASGYFGLGSRVYGKRDGSIPISNRLVLAPCLMGQYLSAIYYSRQCARWNEVTPDVWIGRRLSAAEALEAKRDGAIAVLDVTAEFNEVQPFKESRYRNIQVLDLTAPTANQLREMALFISEQSRSGIVYVHCKIGYSRAAAAVGAYLLSRGLARNVTQALKILRGARPTIVVRAEVIVALEEYERRLRMESEPAEDRVPAS